MWMTIPFQWRSKVYNFVIVERIRCPNKMRVIVFIKITYPIGIEISIGEYILFRSVYRLGQVGGFFQSNPI